MTSTLLYSFGNSPLLSERLNILQICFDVIIALESTLGDGIGCR